MPKLIGLVAHGIAVILRHDIAVRTDGGEDDEIGAGAERADFGDFRRAEAARKRELAFAVDLLTAKHQDGMLFERRAHRGIDGIVGGDIGQRHAAYFGGKTRTQRDDLHGVTSAFLFCLNFPQKRPAGKEAEPLR